MSSATLVRLGKCAIDADSLASELRRNVEGEVRFDAGSRALYSTDASNYRQVPIGVVVPKSKDDIIAALAVCRRHGAPITSRGCGTSLAGQCCNVAVILDTSKYLRRILDLDVAGKRARVEPGVVLDDLRGAAAEHDLTFGCDTSTHAWATIGGSVGNNACGVHSIMCGRTSDNVHELEISTYDGLRARVSATPDTDYDRIIRAGGRCAEIYQRLRSLRDRYADLARARYPQIPRRVSGYNLDDLLPENGFHIARSLVGTEGTCVAYLEATIRLVDRPPIRTLVVLGFSDIYTAADHIPEVMSYGPIGLEGLDHLLVRDYRAKGLDPRPLDLLPEGKGWLLSEFGGYSREEANAAAEKLTRGMSRTATAKRLVDAREQKLVWELRKSGLPATARLPAGGETWEGWEDSAVHPEKLGDYLRAVRGLLKGFGYSGSLYGHFGQGCVHTRIDFGLKSAEGVRKYRAFIEAATDLVVQYHGSFSGEHGDGQSKAEFLPKMFGEELVNAFREFKSIWDPEWKMNPGKVVEPNRIDENLRYGADYSPRNSETHFTYADDHGKFSFALERCVGVGKCRQAHAGTMCPSYMVTHEEMHSTRGRARLLFEMLRGEVIGKRGWKEKSVHEALDLCLSCKACKGECPMQVDMATYKAEFNSHYYAGRLRPRPAYAMGLIFWWARLASRIPRVANFFTQAPIFSRIAKTLGGIAPQRPIPRFAEETFRAAFARLEPRNPQGKRVLLWADTFNNYFEPDVALAAVEVLHALGFRVEFQAPHLCCGRPLYEYGMLDLAKRKLLQVLEALREPLQAGVPLIGLEPSCVATFREELVNLFRDNADARRLAAQTFLFGEFLSKHVSKPDIPQLRRKALVHLHCITAASWTSRRRGNCWSA